MADDLSTGRCVEWLSRDLWRESTYFEWQNRVPHAFQNPLGILQSVKGPTPSYLAFDENPLEGEKISVFLADNRRLNLRFDDWTSARCFWPKPSDIKVPYKYYFFGTQMDMLSIKMIINP